MYISNNKYKMYKVKENVKKVTESLKYVTERAKKVTEVTEYPHPWDPHYLFQL